MPDSIWQIRRAGCTDITLAKQAVMQLHGRAASDDDSLRAFLSDNRNYLFVAVADGRVLGSLNGYSLLRLHESRPQFLLYEIDVRADSRRRGIGTALVNAFVDAARNTAAREVWVLSSDSNAAAIALYQKCGFRRENQDDVMLSRDL
jgi:ribosomal protein S18 acetylase RimI-like enzyme